jgi:hypothetical protein
MQAAQVHCGLQIKYTTSTPLYFDTSLSDQPDMVDLLLQEETEIHIFALCYSDIIPCIQTEALKILAGSAVSLEIQLMLLSGFFRGNLNIFKTICCSLGRI